VKVGITERGIKWQLEQLKNNGIIKRVGADRGGHVGDNRNQQEIMKELGMFYEGWSNVFENRASATHDFQGYFRKTLTTGETITV